MNQDEKEIRALVETWMSATKRGDLETVLGLMAEDVVFLVAGKAPMIGKPAYATAARSHAGVTFDGKSEIQELQVHGDWAFAWARLTVSTTPPEGGPKVERTGHTLSVFRKEHGRWVLARDANLLTRTN